MAADMTAGLEKPLPLPTPVTRPFWEGLAEGRICVQRCRDCDQWVFYPRSHCSHCLSDRLEWREVSGDEHTDRHEQQYHHRYCALSCRQAAPAGSDAI